MFSVKNLQRNEHMERLMLNIFMLICFYSSSVKSQQLYSANEVLNCVNESLYKCNGQSASCTSFLIFKSQPLYKSIMTIASLMMSNPYELALTNNVSVTTNFPLGKEIIVPVNCSCSHQYYQAITGFRVEPQAKTYFIIANHTFQGLSTCGSLKHANHYNEFKLEDGFELKVPLRCACPTKHQVLNGRKYLLTYPISFGDTVNYVAQKFKVTAKSVLKANWMSETNTVYPFTTLLIPMPEKPSISQAVTQKYRPTASVSPVKRSKTEKPLKVGISVLCSILVLTLFLITVLRLTYWRTKWNEGITAEDIFSDDLLLKIASFERILKVFSFLELENATEKFSDEYRINRSVYRGVFGDQILAIKKVGIDVCEQVNMLSKINHINLVKLHGFCKHQDSWYLVFEYMTLGSLKEWLRRQRSEGTHSLCKRVQIAIDVANGLHYLHNFAKPGYVHKNINSSNILLDGDLRAKISNFSLARTTDDGNDDIGLSLTSRIVGTRGYMAPEYVGIGSITSKVDVYSFGVVMLELITGKDAIVTHGGRDVLLSTVMTTALDGENGESEIKCLIDLANEENGSMDYAVQVVSLSLTCMKQDPCSRPRMDEVVSSLVKILVDLQTIVDPCKNHRL